MRRAEGTNLLLDPHLICKKPRRLRGKLRDICKTDTSLMDKITRGISIGFKECEYQFKFHRWNCSLAIKRNMKKILSRGKFDYRTHSIQQLHQSLSARVLNKSQSMDTFRRNDFILEYSSTIWSNGAQNVAISRTGVLFAANWTFVFFVLTVIVNLTIRSAINWQRSKLASLGIQ